MASSFDVRPTVARPVVRVSVVGEVDIATSDRLFETLARLLSAREITRVEVDLSAVTLLGAAGVSVLLNAHGMARRTGKDLRVEGASGLPLKVLEITGVLKTLHGAA